MPLNIDVTFRWGDKKKGEEKQSESESGGSESNCSSCATSEGSSASTSTVNSGVKTPKNGSVTEPSSNDNSSVVSIQHTPKIGAKMASPAKQSVKVKKAKKRSALASSTKSSTTRTSKAVSRTQSPAAGVKPRSTETDYKTISTTSYTKKSADRSATGEGKSSLRSPALCPTPKNLKNPSTSTHSSSELSATQSPGSEDRAPPDGSPRNLIVMRHAERVDRVFPSWIRLSSKTGSYQPYNLNLPVSLPKRRGGLKAFEQDPPITEIGRIVAELTGKSVNRSNFRVMAVFCSPALRCIQTAQHVVAAMKVPNLTVNVEPGLFDWCGWYEIFPNLMTNEEIAAMGVKIDKKYSPVMSVEHLRTLQGETRHDYYRRAHNVINRLLTNFGGTILVVGHALTVDASIRPLLGKSKTVPVFNELDTMCDHYPYCSSVLLNQAQNSSHWNIGEQLPPTTFIDSSSVVDMTFMERK
ncbi:hypothetical protein QR680_007171 [Steinernema hermaphroditum]|uniref:Uncharacterized protein n=1 Tax=Steinernema hermaphroditum TaxID=289476 RepID=A0AA39HZK8_9BILA|nr:hypothetical protein QR680_007171 [Steinernema hermaphroditum]